MLVDGAGAALMGAALDTLLPVSVVLRRPSPNRDLRPRHVDRIACVVLHATADGGDEQGAEDWLTNARSDVSAHLLIRRDGTVVRLVDDLLRAYHAGVSEWRGLANVNDFSLGWEIANRNDGIESFTDAQYAAVARLGAHYVAQGLPISAFVSHASVARPVGRKNDPLGFDWARFDAGVQAAGKTQA